MATTLDIRQILDAAIRREEEAHKFYFNVSKRMQNSTVRETFAKLAQEELGHKSFLERCRADIQLLTQLPLPTDYRVAEATDEPELSIDMKPADALALAMKKEQHAADLYRELAAAAKDASLKATFENLARMELGHKTQLETLFVDIGYPEVF